MADKKDLIARPHKRSLGMPSMENLFPRTTAISRGTRQDVNEAFDRGAVGEGLGKGIRGGWAGGLIALPADIAENVGKITPQPVKDWLIGKPAVDFGRGLIGGSTPTVGAPVAAPAVQEQPAVPAAPAQLQARRPSMRDNVQAALIRLAQPGTGIQRAPTTVEEDGIPAGGTMTGGAGPAGGFENTAAAAGQRIRPKTITQDGLTIPDPVLPASVNRTPRDSAAAGARLPQLPSEPTFGDLMAFRLNALQQGMKMIPKVGQERQTRRAEEEGRAEDTLNLDRFKVKNLVRQGDQTNQIARLDQARRQGNTDRTADLSERRHRLNILQELNKDEPTIADQVKELDAERDYFDKHWSLGPELGEVAREIGEETGVPLPQLQDILQEEITASKEATGSFEITPSNIEKMSQQLRKRIFEAR